MDKFQFKRTCAAWFSAVLNVPPPQEMYENRLCLAFRDLYHGRSMLAIEVINAEFGVRYNSRRYNEWLRNKIPVPSHIKEWMRYQVICARFDAQATHEICQLLDIELPGADLL